ncbi:MAG: S1 RNA-binding domain-containing protein [Oligoflexales bacterium]
MSKLDIRWEEDDNNLEQDQDSSGSFEKMLLEMDSQETGDDNDLRPGDRVFATIVKMGREDILLETVAQTSAAMSRSALTPEQLKGLDVGQRLAVYVAEKTEDELVVSLNLSAGASRDKTFETAYQNGLPVKGRVEKIIKGGFEVHFAGKTAFCPISQIDSKFVKDQEAYLGKTFEFLIEKFDRRNIVVSRARLLQTLIKKQIEDIKEALTAGPYVTSGTVEEIRDYGAMVDLGGLTGMMHVSEASHSRRPLNELVSLGEKIRIQVLSIDESGDRPRVSLSRKALEEDPWTQIQLQTGDQVSATVTRLTKFGAFAEIEAGLEGLIHLSEMSWEKRVVKAEDVLTVGQRVDVRVLEVDKQQKRVSLSMKSADQDPWSEVKQEFKIGQKYTGVVESLKSFGALIELKAGVNALLPISVLREAWGAAYRKKSQAGLSVDVEVAAIDAKERKIRLTLPGLEADDQAKSDFEDYLKRQANKAVVSSSAGGALAQALQLANQKKRS